MASVDTDSETKKKDIEEKRAKCNDMLNKTVAACKLVEEYKSGDRLKFIRSVFSVVDEFTKVPILPLVDLCLPGPEDQQKLRLDAIDASLKDIKESLKDITASLSNITASLNNIIGLFDVLNTRIAELEKKLALDFQIVTDMRSFQEYATLIDICTERMTALLNKENLEGSSMADFLQRFLESGQKNEEALDNLIRLVYSTVGNESIMDLKYKHTNGHRSCLAAFGYLIHMYLFRGMACLQMYTLLRSGHDVWEHVRNTKTDDIRSCYQKIVDILKMCIDNVNENLEKEFKERLQNLDYTKDKAAFDEEWKQLQAKFDFLDMRYLVVELGIPRIPQYNGWNNTVIYRAKDVQQIYNTTKDSALGERGVFIFYIQLSEGQENGSDIDVTARKIFTDRLRAATDTAIVETSSIPAYIYDGNIAVFGNLWAYIHFAGLTEIPSDDNMRCLVMVTDFIHNGKNAFSDQDYLAITHVSTADHYSTTYVFSPQETCAKSASYNVQFQWSKVQQSSVTAWIAKNEKHEDIRKAYDEIIKDQSSDTCSTIALGCGKSINPNMRIKGPPPS